MVINGTVTLANLVLVFCLTLSIGVPLLKALNFAGKFPQLNYKVDEIEKAMDNAPLKTNDNAFTGTSHIVRFDDVRFAYKEQEVLHGVSLELGEGTLTALVGESGSGKSTLAKLIVHYYDLNGGKITLGGQDITDMSIEALNDQISYVSQEQFLFNTTLYENILIGKPDASREEVLAAAEKAQCGEFLGRLPKGIDTMAGDGGKMLSGGERQRIALARAILKMLP
jgi:ATP-binding cassette subfamily B protein